MCQGAGVTIDMVMSLATDSESEVSGINYARVNIFLGISQWTEKSHVNMP